MTTTVNICTVVGKLAYPASNYDDKFLYSRSYSGNRADYDDEVCEARGVVVCSKGTVSEKVDR